MNKPATYSKTSLQSGRGTQTNILICVPILSCYQSVGALKHIKTNIVDLGKSVAINHKIAFAAPKTLVTGKCRFLKVLFFFECVSHDQTAVKNFKAMCVLNRN